MDTPPEDVADALLKLTHRVEIMQRKQEQHHSEQRREMEELRRAVENLTDENHLLRRRLEKADGLVKRTRAQVAAAEPQSPPKTREVPSAQTHHETISQLLKSSPESLKLEHAFFLSHFQREASDICAVIDLQMKIRGYQCWYDQEAAHITQLGMLEGIRTSAVFMLILTKGVFERAWCVFEVRAAMKLGKPIQLLHEADAAHASYAPLNDIIASAPADVQAIFDDNESLPFRRKVYEQQALLDRVLVGNADHLKALQSDESMQEDVLADSAKAMTVYRAGSTATLYIDLGTGQMAFKLLALGADGSLIYEDLLTCPFNLVDRPARQSSELEEVEANIRQATTTAKERIDATLANGDTFEDRFAGVRCGATQWYRDFSEHEVATKAEPALAWLRNTVMRALPASAKWNFEVLSGQEEASLEWISVKHAMAIEFSEEPPIAALAGGKGSVQTSMDGAGGHGAHHLSARVALKEGIALVETNEIDGWRTACTASITQPFGPLREQLQKHSRADSPIRIICSAGFFYVAVAAGVVERKDAPRYLSYESDVRPKIQALVDDEGAKPMDRANGVRFLRCLDFIVSEDASSVSLLFAREWKVSGKVYRVTWSTGAFLQYLAGRYYSLAGEDAV